MKNKALCVITLLSVFLLAAGLLLLPKKEYSAQENRYLESFPELTLESVTNGSFMKDFEIIGADEMEEAFPDAWRVFGRYFDGDTEKLPIKNDLQRNYVKWLEAGNKVGEGYGIILFDGEKIVNRKEDI